MKAVLIRTPQGLRGSTRGVTEACRIPVACHIGMFDVDQCRAVIAAVHRQQASTTQARGPRLNTLPARRTGGRAAPAHCGCNVLPWEDCIHTRRAA